MAFGAAGVSLAMTGAASATAPTTNVPSQENTRQFILGEEEISDVSLATFHVFDRETPSLSQDINEARGWALQPLRRRPLRRCWRFAPLVAVPLVAVAPLAAAPLVAAPSVAAP